MDFQHNSDEKSEMFYEKSIKYSSLVIKVVMFETVADLCKWDGVWVSLRLGVEPFPRLSACSSSEHQQAGLALSLALISSSLCIA